MLHCPIVIQMGSMLICWCIDVCLCFMFPILKHIVNNFFLYKLKWICFIPKFLKHIQVLPPLSKEQKKKSRVIFFNSLQQQQQQQEQLSFERKELSIDI